MFSVVRAQHRNEFWTKINATKSISPRLEGGIDIQHRRQNGFKSNYNMFRYKMTNSLRFWAYYKLNHNWTLILSPFAYFDNYLIKSGSEEIQKSAELRTMGGIVKGFSFGNLINKNRFLYEISSIAVTEPERAIRHRYRLQNAFSMQVTGFKNKSSLNYSVINEILFKTLKGNTNFDQNRIYNGLQWKFMKSDVNAGYQWTLQKEANSFLNKNQLLITLNLSL